MVVDILTAVGAVDALIVQSPQEATTVTAERWKVVILGTEIVRVSLLVAHKNTVAEYNDWLQHTTCTLDSLLLLYSYMFCTSSRILAKAHPLDNYC